jgi:hypothetical protein
VPFTIERPEPRWGVPGHCWSGSPGLNPTGPSKPHRLKQGTTADETKNIRRRGSPGEVLFVFIGMLLLTAIYVSGIRQKSAVTSTRRSPPSRMSVGP